MDEKNLTAQEYNQLTKVSLENIDYSKVDWDAELERHHRMHRKLEEDEHASEGNLYYTTEYPNVLTIARHDGVLTFSDIIKNIMRMIMMDKESDECSGYSAKDAIEEMSKLSWKDFSRLKEKALSYYGDVEWQKYFVRKHITDGAKLKPISEEDAFEIMDEFSLTGFEQYELKDTDTFLPSDYNGYEEIVDKMVDMCVKMFNERHIKTLDDVYGNTNCFDCGELPSVLFSNIDKLALLREGVAYYDGAVESRLTEYEMDVVIDECMKNLSSEEVDVINARRREELSMGFDFENEIRTRMIMYGNYLELAEIANIFAHQGIIEALAYKYENTSAKDMIPFHADNYLHTKYLTFGDALRDYIDFCAGYFSDWDDDDERRAVHRFMDYWRMEKLNQEDVRGNYG